MPLPQITFCISVLLNFKLSFIFKSSFNRRRSTENSSSSKARKRQWPHPSFILYFRAVFTVTFDWYRIELGLKINSLNKVCFLKLDHLTCWRWPSQCLLCWPPRQRGCPLGWFHKQGFKMTHSNSNFKQFAFAKLQIISSSISLPH